MSTRLIAASTGYDALIDALRQWRISVFAGVTGGGVIHFLKHLPPRVAGCHSHERASFFTIGEYAAGFVPLGHFVATGRPAVAVATTGAATKLLACGLSDAKMHNIPAIYVVPVSPFAATGCGPLQDTSTHGSNMVAQLVSELGESVFVLDDPATLSDQLFDAGYLLSRSKPVVLVLVDEALRRPRTATVARRSHKERPHATRDDFNSFMNSLAASSRNRRIVVLAGEELSRIANAPTLTTRLCESIASAVVWTINGANGVERDNRYGYGYILFGGNDKAIDLWTSLGEDDVLLALGAFPDEYTMNLDAIGVHAAFIVTGLDDAYGRWPEAYGRYVNGDRYILHMPLDDALESMLDRLREKPLENRPSPVAPNELNCGIYPKPAAGCVDLVQLYRRLDTWWPAGSIGFDDVCLAYKDRQYITQRPSPNIRFHSFYRGSAMGGAFGAAVGACLGAPQAIVFLFTGDGCFRLFAGYLGEARDLGLVVFVLNNGELSLVAQGLTRLLPDVPPSHYHADLTDLDYGRIAEACGWDSFRLNDDLSNFDDIMERCLVRPRRSILIEVPVDGRQELGKNPRLRNL